MYWSSNKTSQIKLRDQIDMREIKAMYERLLALTQDINQKHGIGYFEFTLTPRALFAPNGNALPCIDKSTLIHILEKHGTLQQSQAEESLPLYLAETTGKASYSNVTTERNGIAVVDGIVLMQELKWQILSI